MLMYLVCQCFLKRRGMAHSLYVTDGAKLCNFFGVSTDIYRFQELAIGWFPQNLMAV